MSPDANSTGALCPEPDGSFTPELTQHLLDLGYERVDLLDDVDSTNAFALRQINAGRSTQQHPTQARQGAVRNREAGLADGELNDAVDLNDEMDATRLRTHLVAARRQEAGRGRLGRRWEAPADSSVMMSVTMPLPADVNSWGWMPLLVGGAALRAIRTVVARSEAKVASDSAQADERGAASAQRFGLKWPNDLVVTTPVNESPPGTPSPSVSAAPSVNASPLVEASPTLHSPSVIGSQTDAGPRSPHAVLKLGGILCQADPAARILVAGIGVNVSQTSAQLPIEAATSLHLQGVHRTSRGTGTCAHGQPHHYAVADCAAAVALRDETLLELARELISLARVVNDGAAVAARRDEVRSRCVTIGSDVSVHTPDGAVIETRATGIGADGQLLTRRTPASDVVSYSVADIVHARFGTRR